MASFAEQLRALSNPEPSRFDLDEDEFDLTRAQVINKGTDLGDNKTKTVPNSSILRKKTVLLLQDEDKKYAGRKISRAQLEDTRGHAGGSDGEEDSEEEDDSGDDMQNGMSEDEGDDDDIDDDSENDNDDVVNDANVQDVIVKKRNKHVVTDDFNDKGDSNDDKSASVHSTNNNKNGKYFSGSGDNLDNEDDDSNEEEEDGDGSNDDDDDDDDEGEEDEDAGGDGIQSFSAASLTDDIEKGTAAKNQLSLWDSFLEMRIRLQKALLVANKLPQQEQMEEFNSSGDKNLKEVYKQGRKTVAKLLGNLLLMQEKLLEQNPDTVSVLNPGADSNKSTAHGSDDDEEIPSDTDDEKSDDGDDDNADDEDRTNGDQAESSLKLPAKRKLELATSEYAEYISKRHAAFKGYRDATISKWSEKTRLASGKLNSKSFSSFDRSALAQINHILSDKDRLIKRTQLKRTAYRVLGKIEDDEKQNMQSKQEQSDLHLRDYDPEIFDDDDFYHQLLREFIEQRTSGSTGNPIEMGRQWLELQKLRRKVKKRVDTKASKGRKIRYDIHGKLVSFMAPIDKGVLTDSSRNELFCSLFGAKQQEQAPDINVFK